jgi:hypothetical protein
MCRTCCHDAPAPSGSDRSRCGEGQDARISILARPMVLRPDTLSQTDQTRSQNHLQTGWAIRFLQVDCRCGKKHSGQFFDCPCACTASIFRTPGASCRLPYNPPPTTPSSFRPVTRRHVPQAPEAPHKRRLQPSAYPCTNALPRLTHGRTVLNRDASGQADSDRLLASKIDARALLRRLETECILL